MSKKISDLIGSVINHKKYGECLVMEVTDVENYKFRAKILSTNEVKPFVFSTQFFTVEGKVKSANVQPMYKPKEKRQYKPVDYNKYRNHPLVKEIDRRESGRRVIISQE